MNEWVSVQEKFPPALQEVLIYKPGHPPICAWLMRERDSPIWWFVEDWGECDTSIYWSDVTHWMPLPKPPPEKEG